MIREVSVLNIYSMEIKSQIKTFLIWTVSILALYIVFMTGMYTAFMDSKDVLENMIKGFPPALADAFGLAVGEPVSIREGGMDQPSLRSFDTAMGLGGAGPVISVTSWPRSASSLQVISVFSCAPPRISRVMIWTIFTTGPPQS